MEPSTSRANSIDADKPADKPEIICIGQSVIDCITSGIDHSSLQNRSARADRISLSAGGDAVNEGIVLSSLGHKVKVSGLIGDDPAGKLIRICLAEKGVDPSGLTVRKDISTVVADIIAENDGARRSINSKAIALGGYAVAPAVIEDGVKLVSLASLFRAPLNDPQAVYLLARKAKENGAILCADTKVPVFQDLKLDNFRKTLELIDYIFPNETEAAFFSGHLPDDPITNEDYRIMAKAFLELGVKNVIIKAGKEGCFFTDGKTELIRKAFPVSITDSTGAGDNLTAGFISSLLEGKKIPECLAFACATAAISLQSSGAVNGVKSKSQVRAFLDQHANK